MLLPGSKKIYGQLLNKILLKFYLLLLKKMFCWILFTVFLVWSCCSFNNQIQYRLFTNSSWALLKWWQSVFYVWHPQPWFYLPLPWKHFGDALMMLSAFVKWDLQWIRKTYGHLLNNLSYICVVVVNLKYEPNILTFAQINLAGFW